MNDSLSLAIQTISLEEKSLVLPELTTLLQETIANGATLGFLPPLTEEAAYQYWSTVFQQIARGTRIVIVAREAGCIVGSVQLAFATNSNAQHRAEVQKLFVSQSQRRRGTGKALMQAIEQVAYDCGRTLLMLNTTEDNVGQHLYRSLGYQEVGIIPEYIRNATGGFTNGICFYKALMPVE